MECAITRTEAEGMKGLLGVVVGPGALLDALAEANARHSGKARWVDVLLSAGGRSMTVRLDVDGSRMEDPVHDRIQRILDFYAGTPLCSERADGLASLLDSWVLARARELK